MTGPTSTDEFLWDGSDFLIREGDTLATLGGNYNNDTWHRINEDGDVALSCTLLGTPGGSSDNEAILLNERLVLQRGASAAVLGFGPSSFIQDFSQFSMSDRNDNGNVWFLVFVDIDDGANNDTEAILRLEASTSGGSPVALLGANVELQIGDSFTQVSDGVCSFDTTETIREFENFARSYSINRNGQSIITARFTGSTSRDWAVIVGGVQGTVVARESCLAAPNTVGFTNTWSNLSSAKVSINSMGNVAILGSISGVSSGNQLISVDGAVYRQKGTTFSLIDPGVIESFGSGPIALGEDLVVSYYAQWDVGGVNSEGLFRGEEFFVQAGQTIVPANPPITQPTIADIVATDAGYSFSNSGERCIGLYELNDGNEGAWHGLSGGPLVPASILVGVSCDANQPTLSLTGGSAYITDAFTLSMDNPQAPGAFALLFFSNKWIGSPAPWNIAECMGFPFGTFGTILLGLNPLVDSAPLFPGSPFSHTGAAIDYTFDLTAVNDPSGLPGISFYFQGVFIDAFMGTTPDQRFRLTNLVQVNFGAL